MMREYRYVLYVAETRNYRARLATIVAKLENHQPETKIDWKRRVTLWLSNFKGLKDQRIAFDILERLLVISPDDTRDACKTLLARIDTEVAKGKPVYHFAHETSGALLVRLLEKDLGIANDRILRPTDFATPPSLEEGSVIVIWDRFNGTGRQLCKQMKKYAPMFEKPEWNGPSVCFAYIAGHAVAFDLPSNVHVLRAIENVPSVRDEKYAEQRDLCDRYASIAKLPTSKEFDTGALIAFADNVTNNVPVILRAPAKNSTWRPLFERKTTRTQTKASRHPRKAKASSPGRD